MLLVERLIGTEKRNSVSVTNRSGNSLESVKKKLNIKVVCCGKVFTAPMLEE